MKTRIANTLLFVTLLCIAIAEPLLACQSPVVEEAAENPRQISTDDLIITWSEKNDELRGYSISLGTWEVLKIEPQEAIAPTGVSNLVVVRLGTSIAAFSAEKGWWDVIELPDATKVNVEIKNDRLVLVQTNEHLYAFVAEKGLWTSPTDPELKAATERVAGLEINRSKIDAFEAWRMTLPLYKQRGLSMMLTGGDVVVRTERQSWMKETREKIVDFGIAADPLGKEPSTDFSGQTSEEIESQIAKLRADFSSLELAVQAGAGSASPLAADKENQARELRTLVEQSFDLRQQLHRLEAERLRLKLQLIETNLSAREKSREAIITRRVEELQSGNGESSHALLTENSGPAAESTRNSTAGVPQFSPSTAAGVTSERSIVGDRIRWPGPSEVVRELRSSKKTYTNRVEQIRHAELDVEMWSKPVEQLKAEGRVVHDAEDTPQLRRQIQHEVERNKQYVASLAEPPRESFLKDWLRSWSEYQSLLKLLRLDVEEAQTAVESLNMEVTRLQKMHDQGLLPTGEVQKAMANLAAAKINLQRTEQVLKLYADIEASEPDLNPASITPEWKPSTNAGNAASVPATAASVDPEPSQPPVDLTNDVPHSSPGPGNLVGSWNEVQEILTLLRTESDSFRRYQEVVEKLKKQIVEYGTPIDKWSEEDVALFKNSFLPTETRVPTRFDNGVWRLLSKKRKVYLEEGLLVYVPTPKGKDLQVVEFSPSFLERIQRDLVAQEEMLLKRLGHEKNMRKHEQAWKETWNAYMNRRQLLELDVQEQKTRLADAKKLIALAQARQAGGSDSSAPESAFRLAEIQLQRAEATLKPYLDVETQHPELNPDYVAPEKPQPEPAVMP